MTAYTIEALKPRSGAQTDRNRGLMITSPTGADVIQFLGWPIDDELTAMADQHTEQVTGEARVYTRGSGFSADGNTVEEDIRQVIVSATARGLSNPSQARRVDAGSVNGIRGSLESFTRLETLVLSNYRRRARSSSNEPRPTTRDR